jgi:hypothetical protein
MRTDLKITFHLDHFYYYNENYEWTTEMPYFWFSFFKIDGDTCKLNEDLKLEGNAVVSSSFTKMENLNNIEPDKYDVIRIPSQLGFEQVKLKPIPVPEFVKKSGINELKAFTGCVAVLMNEECAALDENNSYPEILHSTLQNSLDELIPCLNFEEKNICKYLESIQQDLESKILSESRKNQSFWKRWTTDKIINSTIWKFSSDELSTMKSFSLTQYWGTEGLWELSGEVKVQKAKYSTEVKLRKKRTQQTL